MPTQKNKKELASQRKTQQTLSHQNNSGRRSTTGNSTYPKGGVSCFADTFVQAESSVLRMKFCGKDPALRVAANRWQQLGRLRGQRGVSRQSGLTEHQNILWSDKKKINEKN